MLEHYINKAIEEINNLIKLTEADIEDIKQAKHQTMFDRIKTKEHAIVSFENYKSLIDDSIRSIIEKNPTNQIESVLGPEIQEKLETMRKQLEKLHEINKYYARFVVSVGEFYNSLYEEMIPVERDGYTSKSTKVASLIEVRA